jgi:hypothetical protein
MKINMKPHMRANPNVCLIDKDRTKYYCVLPDNIVGTAFMLIEHEGEKKLFVFSPPTIPRVTAIYYEESFASISELDVLFTSEIIKD